MSEADTKELFELIDVMNERLTRIESRLVQLMLHLGLDPQRKHYG